MPFPSRSPLADEGDASWWSGRAEALSLFNDVTISDGDDVPFIEHQDSAPFSCIIISWRHNDPVKKRLLFHLKKRKLKTQGA